MSRLFIDAIGFLAQILFSSRLIVQWITSERHRKVVTPVLFWMLSLLASLLLFIYGYLRDDFAIMLGQTITYFIYIRNLQLQNQWQNIPVLLRWIIYLIPTLIVIYYFNNDISDRERLFRNEDIPFWLLVLGIISQITFQLRFVYQWLYSERKKASVLPFGFWMLSLIGACLIMVYAIIRLDKVLIVGNSFGIIIYVRNLMLLRRARETYNI
jgi:lipid-A-disaccharide synthase-like uncharacterized protein